MFSKEIIAHSENNMQGPGRFDAPVAHSENNMQGPGRFDAPVASISEEELEAILAV